eukprot:4371582-Amphidinium_carterae.1
MRPPRWVFGVLGGWRCHNARKPFHSWNGVCTGMAAHTVTDVTPTSGLMQPTTKATMRSGQRRTWSIASGCAKTTISYKKQRHEHTEQIKKRIFMHGVSRNVSNWSNGGH